MKLLTSFTKLNTAEGKRISFTYSEIDENGNLISQNNRGNFIVTDRKVSDAIKAVEEYIENNHMNEV